MVVEALLRIEPSPDVDEVQGFDPGNVRTRTCAAATTSTSALIDALPLDGQWARPEKSAKTLPGNVERRFFPDTQITAYRLAA